MGEGAIPWTAVEQYAQTLGLDGETAEDLHHHIREMEMEYLAYRKKKNNG